MGTTGQTQFPFTLVAVVEGGNGGVLLGVVGRGGGVPDIVEQVEVHAVLALWLHLASIAHQ